MPRPAAWLLALSLTVIPAMAADTPPEPPPEYLPQTSEDNVLANLVTAYRHRDAAAYARLLAADYHFVLLPGEPDTTEQRWDRTRDSTLVAALFSQASTIRFDLEWTRQSGTPDNEAFPPQPWTRVKSDSASLGAEFPPESGVRISPMVVTYHDQSWYFRRGSTWPPSTPSDTLTYIVELRDAS